MIYAIVMAGGRGTRLKVNVEKPLFKLHGKPLIKYVLDNISSSKLVEDVVIAVSPHTQETIKYLKSLNGNFQILNTSGIDYLNDLSYILTLFESKSKKDTLLFINADLPFVSGETIDFILTNYLESSKDSLSAQVPVEIFKKLDLKYSYEFNGVVPSGVNVLRSVNEIQDEDQLILPKIELALNINTLKDSIVAEKFYQAFINKLFKFKYDEIKIFYIINENLSGDVMENKQIPKREEKLWSEIKNYQVATNNARILGVLDELIINEKTGKIVDIAIRVESGRNIHVKGAKRNGDILLVPFAKVEKVGEFIIVTE